MMTTSGTVCVQAIQKKKKSNSPTVDSLRRLLRRPAAIVSLAFIILMLLIAIFADVIVPYSAAVEQSGAALYQAPSMEHIFGTDQSIRFDPDLF